MKFKFIIFWIYYCNSALCIFGVRDGEIVEVYNDRGSILAGVVVTNTIRDGVAAIEEGAWYSPEDSSQKRPRCNSGQVNVLTSSRPTSQMTNATTANSNLVAIRKIDVLSPNLAYNPPKIKGAWDENNFTKIINNISYN